MPDPLTLARAIHFAATLLVAGTVTFAAMAAPVLPPDAEATTFRRRCRRLVRWALGIAVISGAGWFALVTAGIVGKPVLNLTLQNAAAVASETRFGLVCVARLALALLIALLPMRHAARSWQVGAACLFVALLAFCGHAGAKAGVAGDIHLVADIGHLIAASAWLGALPALTLLLATARRRKEDVWHAAAVRTTARFSRLGAACVAVLLASGIIASANLLGGPRDLIDTGYGRLLSLKIALFLAMVAVAAVNRFHLTPRLPQSGAVAALIRNSLAETVLGLGVIAAVATLGTMVPGGHAAHHTPGDIPDTAAFVHLHMPEVMADVTVDPGRIGRAHAIIRVMREDASLYPTDHVKFALDPPNAPANSAPHAAKRAADGTWTVDNLALPQPGVWTVRVIVETETTTPAVLDGPIVIGR